MLFIYIVLEILAITLLAFCLFYPFCQVGPTCGMYAIVEAANIKTKNTFRKQRKASKLIREAIKQNLSNVGEIFSIEAMEKVISCYNNLFPDEAICCELEIFHNKRELERLIEENEVIIFPYKAKTYLHYGVLVKGKKNIRMYEGTRGYYRTVNTEHLLKRHNELGKTFSWDEYMKNPRMTFKHFIINPKLYFFIKKCHKKNSVTGTIKYGVKNMVLVINLR